MKLFLTITLLAILVSCLGAPGERVQKKTCKEGEVWKEDCHTCFCSWGKPACTRELCESEASFKVELPPTENEHETTKREAECEEGKVWKEDCHTCHCTHGTKACTRELCLSESNLRVEVDDADSKKSKRDANEEASDEEEKCPPNVKEWEEDCNKCYCGDDGLKVCTRTLCPDQGPVVAIKPKE
uniref:Venom pacifastin Pr24a n=1 Tax=Platymeris rhadamanthus TaxID=1134088 RepID=A0A6B9L4Y9_PLARH|nr:venom pacifastin Pr24a [Platymeris rhadamanthus]